MSDLGEIRTAPSCIPSDDREPWYRMAFVIKSELGDAGFDIWNAWSRTSEKYRTSDARVTWRSAKSSGPVTIGRPSENTAAHSSPVVSAHNQSMVQNQASGDDGRQS